VDVLVAEGVGVVEAVGEGVRGEDGRRDGDTDIVGISFWVIGRVGVSRRVCRGVWVYVAASRGRFGAEVGA